jgi:hypothetical protein
LSNRIIKQLELMRFLLILNLINGRCKQEEYGMNSKKLILAAVGTLAFGVHVHGALIEFELQGQAGSGLLTGNEVTGGTITGGSGGEVGPGITYDDVTKLLNINVGWGSGNGFTDLSSTVTASHIHGPASQLQNTGVQINLGPGLSTSASNGGVVFTTAALTAGQESDLLNGLWYINVHTVNNGAGEIRGNLVAIPEPAAAGLLLIGCGGVYFLKRFRYL